MRKYWYVPVILILFVFQITLAPVVFSAYFQVDFLLILTVFAGLSFGYKEGGAVGLACGLLQDFFAGGFIGLNALAKMLAGTIVGAGEEYFFKENAVAFTVVLFSTTLINGLFKFLLLFLLGRSFVLAAFIPLLGECIGNSVVAFVFYRYFYLRLVVGREVQ